MLRLWVLCGVLCCGLPLVICTGDIGPGLWQVNYITKCETDLHKFKFNVIQKKLNRTHDCFKAEFKLEESFNEDFGVRIDICKYVDGGCKQYQVLSDDCFVNFVNKYAENNVKACLEYAAIDPPEFPIAPVRIDICKYVDGGCKQYQVLSDDCFVNFVNKYAENNVKACLEYAAIDPPEFPIAPGEYDVEDYIFDYTELPDDGIYGTFCAKAYMLKGTEEVGCVEIHVEFREVQEEDDDDCDEE